MDDVTHHFAKRHRERADNDFEAQAYVELQPKFGNSVPIKALRSRARSRRIDAIRHLARCHPAESLAPSVLENAAATEVEPILDVAAEEAFDVLRRQIDRMSPLCKEVIKRRYWRGESFATIAHDLRISEAAVRQNVSRAIKRLRNCALLRACW
jgi:RNA polymerase sigma factor (sigma-70 family)